MTIFLENMQSRVITTEQQFAPEQRTNRLETYSRTSAADKFVTMSRKLIHWDASGPGREYSNLVHYTKKDGE